MTHPSASPRPPTEHPPPPPRFQRRLSLGAGEAIGMPLLALLPALALAGLLGPADEQRSMPLTLGNARLLVRVRLPARLRDQGSGSIRIEVANTGTQALPELGLGIDERYLAAFSRADIQPAVAAQSRSGGLRWALPALQAGEHTQVQIRLDADAWGRQPGWIALTGPGDALLARLDFTTFVLP